MADKRQKLPVSFWWLVAGWVIVTGAAVIWAVPHQEQHLAERATAVASELIDVDFAGRDARLRGAVATTAELDRAIATIREIRGVRRVDSTDMIVLPPPPNLTEGRTPPQLSIVFDQDAVTLTGTLPNQEIVDALRRSAVARAGEVNVVDELTVGDNTAGAAWIAGLITVLDGATAIRAGSFDFGPAGVAIRGSVATDAQLAAFQELVAGSLGPGIPIDNGLEVVALRAPSFEAEMLQDGSVRLRGVLPDDAIMETIFDAAAGVFGSANVANEMTVGELIARPRFLSALPGIFGVIDGLRPWQLNVSGTTATVSGLAVSEDAIAASISGLTTVLSAGGLTVTSDIQTDAGAVATVLTELLEGTATFAIGSARLSNEAEALLDEAIEILNANPTTVLVVEGHTDDVGSEDANLALSEARAQAVVDYLVAGGVDEARLTAVGFGESRPLGDNATAAGRAENRRIQFVVEGEG